MGRTSWAALFMWFVMYVDVVAVVWSADTHAAPLQDLNIWPMPMSLSYGDGVLFLTTDFQLYTHGTNFLDHSGILKDAFSRTLDVITATHVIQPDMSFIDPSLVLKGIHVLVASPSDELQHGVNESYQLYIPEEGNPHYARIEAQTVYGALHGLQTFSQVCRFDIESRGILAYYIPLAIRDQPRFPYRGVLIDTSRHYQPLPMIKKVIDSMSYAKLNVLHWHIVDTESFPLEIPSYPKLWDGAYSLSERYTFADAAEIVSYAKKRGINVLAEIDLPGHAGSWGFGYPSLWPSSECKEPLDVSNEFTFELIDGILSDFSKIFKYKFVHLGGDEVNTSCWESTPHVRNWLNKRGMNGSAAYEYFVQKAQKIARSHGYEVVNWEEIFTNFGSKLDPRTIIHNWFRGDVPALAVAAGLRCIVSDQGQWYLDHLWSRWQDLYGWEPLRNITNPKEQGLILGGEVCLWGEHIDASNVEQILWPRAAAAAERLWTPYEKLQGKDLEQVKERLSYFRCFLNGRGVAAASPLLPLSASAFRAPLSNSCYLQ